MPDKNDANEPLAQNEGGRSFADEKNELKRVKPKDQGIVEADDQKENREIYDGSLQLKVDEATEEHEGELVEEVDHDPWGEEPDYGYQYDKEIVDREVGAGEGVYTPEGREELAEDDEITSEEAFYMEGRDEVLKRKTKGFTNNPEIQQQWKDD
ncbi:MAG TPA: hypothetical protein VEG65_05080 [Candidatus Bathyarchaeia archaeon]|nr:hypothetical protein [Candidatus Bathyarchaeia archaeon]